MTAEAWVLVALVAFLLVAFGLVVRWAYEACDVAMGSLAAQSYLRRAITAAIADLDAEHHPDPELKGRGGCGMCWPKDGSWPCTTREVADDLRKAIGEGT